MPLLVPVPVPSFVLLLYYLKYSFSHISRTFFYFIYALIVYKLVMPKLFDQKEPTQQFPNAGAGASANFFYIGSIY